MNIEIIKEKYPKSYNKLGKWLDNQLNSAYSKLEDNEVNKALKETITNELIINLTLSSPQTQRNLYDFFDFYSIHMFVMGSIEWQFKIIGPANHNNKENEQKYPNRILAEEAGYFMAFSELENKLS